MNILQDKVNLNKSVMVCKKKTKNKNVMYRLKY
jgi:hypothetical protein